MFPQCGPRTNSIRLRIWMSFNFGMNFIRTLQTKRYRRRIKKDTARINKRLQLPVEILEAIFAHVSDKETLAVLCRVSRTVFAIAAPIQYKRLTIHNISITANAKLARALNSPRYSYLIVNLIIFAHRYCTQSSVRNGRCGCEEWELSMGRLTCELRSLKSLQIRCKMCRSHFTRLDFLANLKTRSLRELNLECSCAKPAINTRSILHAPCMRNVTMLGWSCGPGLPWQTTKNYITDDIFEDYTVLPELMTIRLEEESQLTHLLQTRPITRLGLVYYNEPARRHLLRVAGSLTHLNIGVRDSATIQFLEDVGPRFQNLRYLGRLAIDPVTAQTMLQTFQTLRPLAHTLEGLKLDLCRWDDSMPATAILAALENLLPNLKAVLFDGDEVGVRFKADSWAFSTVEGERNTLSVWQTLNGDLERIILSQA
ncbi:hypothetical protein PIIN_06263 [Serendipita indica DSM 11827]|uniref:F-box domain-containing protein n=1 Tax=Serendipita indica (strain DSM 11827) TaxID=1109443 RepID=G4TLY6_SERID|nr:hypothetical protein PIIN_06263 [Serendipita indica DSM 11827]